VSSVGSSTRGLESSLEVALERIGQSGWVGFISDWFFFCVRREWLSNYAS
jgi:hypothetical protein